MVSCIWDHFTKDPVTDHAVCNLCSLKFGYKRGSTSNLLRHLKNKHPVDLVSSNAEFDELCEKIVRLVTVDNAAFRFVDRPEFHAFLPSHIRRPTRYHISNVVMPSMVQKLKDTIRERLAGKPVTLCIDQWVSKGGRITLSCFNAHYMNENGELQRVLLLTHDHWELLKRNIVDGVLVPGEELRNTVVAQLLEGNHHIAAIEAFDKECDDEARKTAIREHTVNFNVLIIEDAQETAKFLEVNGRQLFCKTCEA